MSAYESADCAAFRLQGDARRSRAAAGSQLIRGVLSGLAGTAMMTGTVALQKRLRHVSDLPVDYDATDHVVTAAATVLRIDPRTAGQREALFLLVHWGYGSAVAVGYRALRARGLSRPVAAVFFFAGCQTMAFALFPLVGGTAPPWRWRPDVLLSSLVQHSVYVAGVAAADRVLTGD